jgi:hypothetical protein
MMLFPSHNLLSRSPYLLALYLQPLLFLKMVLLDKKLRYLYLQHLPLFLGRLEITHPRLRN